MLTIGCGLLVTTTSTFASPKMHLTEHRILLTAKKSKHDYQFYNQGSATAECKTRFIDFNVDNQGKLTPVKQVSATPVTSAKSFLRASPKRVSIAPNQAQRIKVIARNLKKQPNGEWVSYLSLSCKQVTQAGQKGMNLSPNFVFNIPVIVRKGQLSSQAFLSHIDIKQQHNKTAVELLINRQGQRSLYGRVDIFDQDGTQLGFVKGLSVYQQTQSLPIRIALKKQPTGKIKIQFTEDEKFGDAVAKWLQP
ncbi:hypothetical protein [Algibacillus agarilyticus]|uniref:hypothetical protein n=1 Tax=Algibacillus agarilyticus TaxID=2234133 RepID=UPI000DCF93D8|nr:hypothetical protein [Algibacillus agarilyticus]